jgi:hypothetical protein
MMGMAKDTLRPNHGALDEDQCRISMGQFQGGTHE